MPGSDSDSSARGTSSSPHGQGNLAARPFRADRVIVDVFGCIRASYVVTGVSMLAVKGDSAYLSAATQGWLLAGVTAWSAILFWSAHRAGEFSRWMVLTDCLIAAALVAFGTRQCVPAERLTWGNWSFTYGLSASLIAGASNGLAALPEVALLVVCFLFGLWPSWRAAQVTNLIGNTSEFAWFALIAFLASLFLHRIERKLDSAFTAQVAAESRRAALSARYTDQLINYGMLHDTVLSTLTAIARGGLDHQVPQVKERCAREAEYLRRLIHGGLSVSASDAGLDNVLSRLVAEADELGMRVRYFTDTLPDLPPETVTAISRAAREALNNVRAHAGTEQAWIAMVADGGGVTVTVTDRGNGFDQQRATEGFGISRSIAARMLDAGGVATITSVPGHGTSVELRWPR